MLATLPCCRFLSPAAAAAMLLLRANPLAAVPVSFSTATAASCSHFPWPSSATATTARCSVGTSANLSAAVQFDPLRSRSGSGSSSSSDPWGQPDGMATAEGGEEQRRDGTEGDSSNDWEGEGPQGPSDPKGISGIHVPRQRYIAVPKAALLDAVLAQFASDADAADFKRCAR